VIAILAAMRQRDRDGCGQHIDMALMDSMVSVLANQALNYLSSGQPPHRMGNAHPNIVPYQVFEVSDGHVILAVGNDAQFTRLCQYLDLCDVAADVRFSTNRARVENRAELIALMNERLSKLSRGEVLVAMEERGVPAGPINTLEDVFSDPQVVHRQLELKLAASWAAGGVIPGLRTPISMSRSALSLGRPSPRLGEHTAEILSELESESVQTAPSAD
jgi:crotonobetainyl-CoA:carnitine CoA-transferase CaiB-like acyl-CoA transferase